MSTNSAGGFDSPLTPGLRAYRTAKARRRAVRFTLLAIAAGMAILLLPVSAIAQTLTVHARVAGGPLAEGDSPATADIRITLAFNPPVASTGQSIEIVPSGTAVFGEDYRAPATITARLPAGTLAEHRLPTFTVEVLPDARAEGPEAILFETGTLAGPLAGYRPVPALVVIADDDRPSSHVSVREILPDIGRAIAGATARAVGNRVALAFPGGAGPAPRRNGGAGAVRVEPLPGAAFATDRERPVPNVAVWTSGDFRRTDSGDDAELRYEGDLVNAHVGFDARAGESAVVGLAISRSEGRMRYLEPLLPGHDGYDWEARMVQAAPYLGFGTGGGGSVWISAGYGWGEVAVDGPLGGESADATMATAALGGMAPLHVMGSAAEGGADMVLLRADASYAALEVEGNGMRIAPIEAEAGRARLELVIEGENHHADGASAGRNVSLGVRSDFGDGEEGTGLEAGAGVRYVSPDRSVLLEAAGHYLVADTESRDEWGLGGLLLIAPDRAHCGECGVRLTISPGLGAAARADGGTWDTAAAGAGPGGLRLDTELGYGLEAPGLRGALTPYGGLGLSEERRRLWRLGGRLEVGRSANLSLEGQRRESGGGAAEQGVMLKGLLRL